MNFNTLHMSVELCYHPTMDSVTLPDGTIATVVHSFTWGEATIAMLLLVLVVLELYRTWREHK